MLLTWEDEGVESLTFTGIEEHFSGELTAWSKDLTVEVDGHGVVSHAESAVVGMIADGTGLTAGLSRALARRGFVPVHDRGRVLADTAVLIADGGRVLSDLATLRDQGELFGSVAWRSHVVAHVERDRSDPAGQDRSGAGQDPRACVGVDPRAAWADPALAGR